MNIHDKAEEVNTPSALLSCCALNVQFKSNIIFP